MNVKALFCKTHMIVSYTWERCANFDWEAGGPSCIIDDAIIIVPDEDTESALLVNILGGLDAEV